MKVTLDLMENQEKMEIQDSLEQMVIQEKEVHQDPLVPKVLKVSRENVVVLSVLEIKVLKERLEIKDQLDCQVCIILYLCVLNLLNMIFFKSEKYTYMLNESKHCVVL